MRALTDLSPILASACAACAVAVVGFGPSSAAAASLSLSVDVPAPPAAVWALIGPFCAIGDWHPAIRSCDEDGKSPPTRTLLTRDGKGVFVEVQTARSETNHLYAYAFRSSPLPVTHYSSTLRVVAKRDGVSTVTWSGAYVPDPGKAKQAEGALTGIYQSGLSAIRERLAH